MQSLLFNNLISDLGDGTECTFCRFTGRKVCSHSEVPGRLVKWQKGISFNSTKGSGEEQNTLGASYFGSSLTEKHLEVLVDSKLNKPVGCP